MARKVIVSRLDFFILKLWEFARLFIAMACVNLVFPPQKLNSNATLQLDTKGFNAAFSQWIPSVSVVQFTVQMSKLNDLGKTHRTRLLVELKTSLTLSLRTNCLREFRFQKETYLRNHLNNFSKFFSILGKLRHFASNDMLSQLFSSLPANPFLAYGIVVWGNTSARTLKPLQYCKKQ